MRLNLGFSRHRLRRGLTTGITISIMPTLPVLLVLLSLMPLLGTPLPWLRLSIIGSAYYETYAASTALECVGETLQVNGYSVVGWVAAAWVMTIGGSACVLWSSLAIKPISMIYEKAEKVDIEAGAFHRKADAWQALWHTYPYLMDSALCPQKA